MTARNPRTGGHERSGLFRREFDELDGIFALVRDFLAGNGIDERPAFDLDLIVEELFTNMVKYNRSSREIGVRLRHLEGAIEIVVTDFDVEPYDITQAPELDPQRSLADGARGGLGLHLVRMLADKVGYEHSEGRTTITVIKELES